MGSEIIERDESAEIKRLKGWIIIYGRRKVGKTFLIKNFLHYDTYFRVNKDGKIIAEKFALSEINNLNDFSKAVQGLLEKEKTIVIDEFQRLPDGTLEEIAIVHPKGKVIFCGSSMRIIKKIFSIKSPLLGLTLQYKLGLVKPKNMARELLKLGLKPEQAIELSPYLSDIWTVSFFHKGKPSTEMIYELLRYSKLTIPALIGEIFTEEEREITRNYDAILKLLGAGEWDYKCIAKILSDRGIISKPDSSLVIPYIKNLTAMGLVETLPRFSSKKKMYKLASPIMEAFYYLSDRYKFEEIDVSFSEVKPTLEKLRNLAIQNWIADLFAEVYGGKKEYYVTPSKEIDFIITIRNKPAIVGEVKWGRYDRSDILRFKENTKFVNAKKVFITKEDTGIKDEEVSIIDVKKLVMLVGIK